MDHIPPTLDMRLDGSFRTVPRTRAGVGAPWSLKLMLAAVLIAVVGSALAFAALAVWVLSMVLPVVLAAAVFAWGMLKFRRWQAMRGGRSLRPF